MGLSVLGLVFTRTDTRPVEPSASRLDACCSTPIGVRGSPIAVDAVQLTVGDTERLRTTTQVLDHEPSVLGSAEGLTGLVPVPLVLDGVGAVRQRPAPLSGL